MYWRADWSNVRYTTNDSIRIAFISLSPEISFLKTSKVLPTASYTGAKKYIIVKSLARTNSFYLGSYFGSNNTDAATNLNKFTGKLILESLDTKNSITVQQYVNGKITTSGNVKSPGTSQSMRTTNCTTYEFCTWTRTYWGNFYILETQGINECNWPREDPQSWMQTSTRYQVQCDDFYDAYDPGYGYIPDNSGGSGVVESPNVPNIFPLPINGIKVNPTTELKCFDKNVSAKIKIFVQQPNPGTRDKMGPRQVGHAFIGIEQNGVTRYIGYYPESNSSTLLISVGSSYKKEIRDNSGELYDVTISKAITNSQLTDVINFIINAPGTYNLNSYNCTDFAIDVASKGGISLPKTTSSQLTFTGRNPGDLGEDIKEKTLKQGETRTTNTANAPQKSGSCN